MMANRSSFQTGQRATLVSVALVSLSFSPRLLDPFNLPKFFILIVSACSLLALLTMTFQKITQWNKYERQAVVASLIFSISLCLTVFVSQANLSSQLYGEFGRLTGLITQLALLILFIAGQHFFSESSAILLLRLLILIGLLNGIYGFLQWLQFDIVSWSISTNEVIGTLGNSNFLSAFLGMSSLSALALSFGKIKKAVKVNYGLIALFLFLVVILTNSLQGTIIIAVGSIIIVYKRFLETKTAPIRIFYFLLVSIFSSLTILGVFNIGFLKQFLFQDSNIYRLDYWNSALNMISASPIYGRGLDTYGSYYREYRSAEAASRRGLDQVSNSAHNAYLEVLVNGGIILFTSYLIILFLTFKSLFRILKRSTKFDEIGVGLGIVWIGYFLQSLISVSSIAILSWGWLLSGAIIAYDQSIAEKQIHTKKGNEENRTINFLNRAHLLRIFLSILIGIYVAIWPIKQDMKFREAFQSGNAKLLLESATSFPYGQRYGELAAKILLDNGFNREAKDVAEFVIIRNSRAYDAYLLLMANPLIDGQSRRTLEIELIKIEPKLPKLVSQNID